MTNLDKLFKYFFIALVIYALGYAHCWFAINKHEKEMTKTIQNYSVMATESTLYLKMLNSCMKANEHYIDRIMRLKRR